MSRLVCIAILILLLSNHGAAIGQPSIRWKKTFGGSGVDAGNSVQRTTDGGYILAGSSNSIDDQVSGNHGGDDYWIVKTDDTGRIQWQKSYGGSRNDEAWFIQNDVNGGYIIGGTTESNDGDVTGYHGGGDAWVVKIDDTGRIVWQKAMGSIGSDYVNNPVNTPDSGYIITGSVGASGGDATGFQGQSDAWVIRLSKTGAVIWSKAYGSTDYDFGLTGYPTADGGYIISAMAGRGDGDVTFYHGGYSDAWIIKLNDTGAIQWQKTYGGSQDDDAVSIAPVSGGGYIFSGSTTSYDGDVPGGVHGVSGNPDMWVVRINDTGAIQWANCYGGDGAEYSAGMIKTFDGTYAIAGMTTKTSDEVTSSHGYSDFWLIDVDTAGALVWEECFGGYGYDSAFSIIQTPDSGFVLIGGTTSVDEQVSGNHGAEDYWVVRLFKPDTVVSSGVAHISADAHIRVFPTVTSSQVQVSMPAGYENAVVDIISATGQKAASFPVDHTLDRTYDLAYLPGGMYILTITNDGAVQNFKIIRTP